MSKIVEIFEVGPRDGLQNEPVFIALADKIALTEALARTGLPRIECASFVSPKWVPQMVDCAAVVTGITPDLAELYALAPNTRVCRTLCKPQFKASAYLLPQQRALAGPIRIYLWPERSSGCKP